MTACRQAVYVLGMRRSYAHSVLLLVGMACATAGGDGASSRPAAPNDSGRRYAIVIGNAEYQGNVRLGYPASDVERIASSLERVGFETSVHRDLSSTEISSAVTGLTSKLESNDEVFFYFTGLALSLGSDKRNYLLGKNFRPEDLWADPGAVDAVRLTDLVGQFEDSKSKSRTIIVNSACDSHMAGTGNYGKHTLASESASPTTLLSLSVAKEKLRLPPDAASPFADAIARGIESPKASIRGVLANAAVVSYRGTEGLHTTVVDGPRAEEFMFTQARGPSGPQASPDLPFFPWPVPQPSARLSLSRATVEELLGEDPEALNLREASEKMGRLANRAGYSEKRFFRFGRDGFAMMTRIERFNRDGKPFPPPRRFTGPSSRESFTLTEFLTALFIAPVGFYRVIVMVVTPNPGYPISQQPLEAKVADIMMDHAPARLHGELTETSFSADHGIDVLVYEFRRTEQKEPEMLPAPLLPVETHLTSTQLLTIEQLRR